MARRPSLESLSRQVTMLQRQRDAAEDMINRLAKERDQAREDLAEKVAAEGAWYNRWIEKDKEVKAGAPAIRTAEAEADRWRTQAFADRELRLQAEAQRDRDRGYIEGLLDGMHPHRPVLAWEKQPEFFEVPAFQRGG